MNTSTFATAEEFLEVLPQDVVSVPVREFLIEADVRSFHAAEALVSDRLKLLGSVLSQNEIVNLRALHHVLRSRGAGPRELVPSMERGDGVVPPLSLPELAELHKTARARSASDLKGRPGISLFDRPQLAAWKDRDQGRRNTCVGFAVAACLDGIDLRAGKAYDPHSPQFLYWNMRSAGHDDNEPQGWDLGATKLTHAKSALEQHGSASERTCPYVPILDPGQDLAGKEPSEAAFSEAGAREKLTVKAYDHPSQLKDDVPGIAQQIYEALEQTQNPVAIAVPTFELENNPRRTNWNSGYGWATGQIPLPPTKTLDHITAGEVDKVGVRGHAVCVIGYIPGNDRIGGWFLFKNSWGPEFAARYLNSEDPQVPDEGYGVISASYIEEFCWEWMCFHTDDGA